MIPTKNNDIVVTNNMGGNKVAIKFDENSLAHIMSVLTDLYSDPELAVIREYSTNALDSHVAAKISRPIEISLPGPLSPYFKVKDYGVGMSVDDIESIYSKYGASTKRSTDDQVGMLGLGCKSALTYVNQFTVTAIKGGVKTQVSVGRNEDGTGTMEIIDTVSTNDFNGVEITVPVKNASSFSNKAKNFFSFWAAGTVIIDGKPVDGRKVTKISDRIFLSEDDTTDYIVMGSVAYPLDNQHSLSGLYAYFKNFGTVVYVDIGDVHFTPSRESLHYTSKTLTTIARVKEELKASLEVASVVDISNSTSFAQARKNYNKWNKWLGKTLNTTYKGHQFPSSLDFGKPDTTGIVYYRNRSRNANQTERAIPANDLSDVLIVTGFTATTLTSTHRSKAKQWADNASISPAKFVFVEKMFGDPWTDEIATVDFSVVKKEVLPKNTLGRQYGGRGKTIAGSFYVYEQGVWVERDDLKSKDKIIYVPQKNHGAQYQMHDIIVKTFPTYKLVSVADNRIDKFLRDFPGAKEHRNLMSKHFKSVKDSLTDADKMYNGIDRNIAAHVRKLDLSRVDDPAFAQYLVIAEQSPSKRLADWNTVSFFSARFGVTGDIPRILTKDPFSRYPLISNRYSYNDLFRIDDLYIYLNAAYAAQKKDN